MGQWESVGFGFFGLLSFDTFTFCGDQNESIEKNERIVDGNLGSVRGVAERNGVMLGDFYHGWLVIRNCHCGCDGVPGD